MGLRPYARGMSSDLSALLAERGAVMNGHFQFASGRHGEVYIEKFRILQWPDVTTPLCAMMAEHFRGKVNTIVGPTTGGAILSFEVARQLGLRSLIAERNDDGPGREFKRGFTLGAGDRVLIVDDVLTTGGSIRDVIDAVAEKGAELVGVAVLVDRTNGKVDFGTQFFACIPVNVESFDPADCQLCRDGVSLKIT